VIVDTGPPQVILKGNVTGVAVHITPRPEFVLRVLMEFLVTGQTVLRQGQIHLLCSLLIGKEYMKALALFAQDPGRAKKLSEPESKRAEPVLQGSVTFEGVLSLPHMRKETTVIKIEVLSG
jgi:hypothetical protein